MFSDGGRKALYPALDGLKMEGNRRGKAVAVRRGSLHGSAGIPTSPIELMGIPVGKEGRRVQGMPVSWCPMHYIGVQDVHKCHEVRDIADLRRNYQAEA